LKKISEIGRGMIWNNRRRFRGASAIISSKRRANIETENLII
jgi:hypothetical protein